MSVRLDLGGLTTVSLYLCLSVFTQPWPGIKTSHVKLTPVSPAGLDTSHDSRVTHAHCLSTPSLSDDFIRHRTWPGGYTSGSPGLETDVSSGGNPETLEPSWKQIRTPRVTSLPDDISHTEVRLPSGITIWNNLDLSGRSEHQRISKCLKFS